MAEEMQAANKEEGLKCLGIAQQALDNANIDKAVRFAEKALRLYPSDEVKAFLARVQTAASATPSTSEANGSTPSQSNGNGNGNGPSGMGSAGLHQRGASRSRPAETTSTRRTSPRAAAAPRHDDSKATPEQRTLVASILSKSCYYEILGVARGAGDDDIKRAYRKLALKLHPDKNRAHRADDAFKSVSKAFTCLSDPTKRQHYDAYGQEEPSMGRQGGGFGNVQRRDGGFGGMGGGGGGFFNDDIDPEEIFRMFFGGNPFMAPAARVYTFGGGQGVRRRHHPQHRQHQHQQQQGGTGVEANALRTLLSIAPLFLLLLFNLFSGSSRPAFALSQSRQHPVPLATASHGVPYYVTSAADFSQRYPIGSRERTRVEMQVESEWKEAMQRACYNERLMRHRYEYYGQKARAAKVSMASCEELEKRFGDRTHSGGAAAAG